MTLNTEDNHGGITLSLSGKGIVCEVYYINEHTLNKLINEAGSCGSELRPLVAHNAEQTFLVCNGFCVDQNSVTCVLSTPDAILFRSQFADHEAWEPVLGADNSFVREMDVEGISSEVDISEIETPRYDPLPDEACLVSYTEFEQGVSSTPLPISSLSEIMDFKFECIGVESYGFLNEVTYGEAIVGTEEYEYAESAIHHAVLNGHRIPIATPEFSFGRSRVWLYKWNREAKLHEMDFLGSKALPWPADNR